MRRPKRRLSERSAFYCLSHTGFAGPPSLEEAVQLPFGLNCVLPESLSVGLHLLRKHRRFSLLVFRQTQFFAQLHDVGGSWVAVEFGRKGERHASASLQVFDLSCRKRFDFALLITSILRGSDVRRGLGRLA